MLTRISSALSENALEDVSSIPIPDANTGFGFSFDPMLEWDNGTRLAVNTLAHKYIQSSPLAQALKFYNRFAVQDGFTLSCPDQRVLDDLNFFIKNPENDLRRYERHAPLDLNVEGEIFLQLERTQGGDYVINPIIPTDVKGIVLREGFKKKFETFWVQRNIMNGVGHGAQYVSQKLIAVPGADVIFVAINNRAYELRGRSSLYPVLKSIERREEWLSQRSIINRVRAYLLMVVKLGRGTKDQKRRALAALRRAKGRGDFVSLDKDSEISAIAPQIRAQDARDDGDDIVTEFGVGLSTPYYMLSTGEKANLATATRQQLPSLMAYEEFQRVLVEELWYPLFRLYVKRRVEDRRLPSVVDIEGVRTPTEYSFNVSYKSVIEENTKELSEALAIQKKNGLISGRAAMERLGYDPEEMQAQIDAEEEAAMDAYMRSNGDAL